MSLNAFLIFVLANIYVTSGSNGNTSTTIARQHGDEFNFGHSGYVYLPSDPTPPALEFTKCQNYDVNVTSCTFMNKTVRTTQDIILMRAWLSVTLRDNIATMISYLLHLPNDTFTNEIYSSLNLIYHEVQKNNIKVMDLLMRMKPTDKMNTFSQLVMLFKSLHPVVPSYCRNAVDNVSKLLSKKKDRLKNTLSSAKEAGIDLFADVPIGMLPLLRFKNPPRNFNQTIEAFHGKEYAVLFSQILGKKILSSQPVLAVLMLNTRFNQFCPQTMEDLRFLADVLRYNKIKNWEFNGSDVEPYGLIRKALVDLKEASEVDQVIKDTVENLLKYLIKPLNTEAQQYFDTMRPFSTRASLNVSSFFEQLARDLNTPDAMILKNLIDSDKIKYPYAVRGFIHHYYDSPNKLRLAFLQRIRHRVPVLNSGQQPLVNVINFLRQRMDEGPESENSEEYQTKKQKRNVINSLEFPFFYPQGARVTDSSIMICGSSARFMDELFNGCSYKSTKVSLTSWLQRLDDTADVGCPIERIQNISTILEIFLNDSKILKSVEPFILELPASNNTGNVGAVHNKSSEYKIENSSNRSNLNQNIPENNVTEETVLERNSSHPNVSHQNTFNGMSVNDPKFGTNDPKNKMTKKDQLIHILKSMLSLKNVRARPIVYYEVIRLYCILVHGPGNHSTSLNLDDTYPVNMTGDLIGNNSFIVSKVLNDSEFIKNLSSIQFEDYPKRQLYLVALFKKMLTLEYVKQDHALFNEVVRLLRSIIPLPIELEDLTKAIVLDSLDDAPWVHTIADFLSEKDTIKNLGDDFDVGFYRTKGSLLSIILHKSLDVPEVRDNARLNIAINKMLPKIDCSSVGAEQVKGIEDGATMDVVDLKKMIKNGLDRENMTSEVLEAFSNMVHWHGGYFDPLKYVREMNISLYNTRAEFFDGFLENIARNIETKVAEMKKDIDLMRTAIKRSGTGSEPVDYL